MFDKTEIINSSNRRNKNGVVFNGFFGTKTFINKINNKLKNHYIQVNTKIGKTKILIMHVFDMRIKNVNIKKGKSNKKMNKFLVETHDFYKNLINNMNWNEQAAFCETMKSMNFIENYFDFLSKKTKLSLNLNKFKESFIFNAIEEKNENKFMDCWIKTIRRDNLADFMQKKCANTKKDAIKYIDNEINELYIKKENFKKMNLDNFFESLISQIKIDYGDLKFSLNDLLNSEKILDINLESKKCDFSKFQLKVILYKNLNYIVNIFNSFGLLILEFFPEDKKTNLKLDELIKYSAKKISKYGERVYRDSVRFVKSNSQIKSPGDFICELDLFDNMHLLKTGNKISSFLEKEQTI